ncbi:CPBP family intramembrane metalloprotease [Nitriliruptoraceae bacterium ZYF776]|nr:CPBP family intramembrane metalloprotease [Profundirhabdus halotolerans]
MPRNLALTALLLWVGRRAGLSFESLGLARDRWGSGLRVGLAAFGVVGVAIGIGVLLAETVPPIGLLLSDQRAAVTGGDLAVYALVRIPLGTALFEEVAFRGVLFAAFLAVTTPWRATWWSSAVFGLWHVAPTAVALSLNDLVAASWLGVALIVGAVLVTTVAGALFTWLRWRSGSVLAPIVAHVGTNSLGLTAAAFVGAR